MLNRPDVIEQLHASMIDAGAEVVETDTFQGSRIKLDEWGLGEHTLEINRKAAEIARKAVGEEHFVAGSIGPTGFLPASDDPTLGDDPLPRPREGLRGAGPRAARGRRRPDHHRDGAGHPRGQGLDLRRPRGVQGDRPRGADPGLRLAAAQRRQDAARHRHLRRAGDARGARRRRHRPQLLDRPRGHARRRPLPRRALPDADPLHPERRHPPPGPRRRDDLPGRARAARRGARRLRRALRPRHRRRLLRHDDRAHPRDRRALHAPPPQAAPRPAPDPRLLDDGRDAARAGAGPDDRRRARQLAGLAQGQGDAAGRRLRRPRHDRRGPGRGRRARARPLRRADRAPGRGRADAPRRQARRADPARPDPGRLDRARGDRDRARPDPRPRDRQLRQPRGRPRQARPRRPGRQGPRRRADRADDRRGRHGQDARPQARDRPAHQGARLRRARPRARGADLRRADLHADHRRRRVEAVRRRDDRGHPADQVRDAGASRPRSASPTSPSASACPRARS